jgi:anhydro-N-acetylmuramic acid kinase
MTRVIGLISGTSVDGIDTALVEITGTLLDLQVTLLSGLTYPYLPDLRDQILRVCAGEALSMVQLAALDDAIAHAFARAALALQANYLAAEWIGSHGQTVYHQPPQNGHLGYSLQLGRGDVIARQTQIPTISNFRVADIAAGGHGAPLVSKVDAYLLSHESFHRCIQNLGGIGNVTYLPAHQGQAIATWEPQICGWDTGPGNVLIDLAVHHFSEGHLSYDQDGAWAAQGTPDLDLVETWLSHPFFNFPPPKSTGRECFGPEFLRQCLHQANALSPEDLLASLVELTVLSIVRSYQRDLPHPPDQVLLCGGGSRNHYLRHRLQTLLAPIPVLTTDDLGLDSDYKEAIAFAILAYWRSQGIPGNLPRVTGAQHPTLLGEIHLVGSESHVSIRSGGLY